MRMERKYIFVTGGVLSSVGKGSVAASIGKCLQARGYSVALVKIDPYLNYDSGLMNPFIHGEVFVSEDGGETDLDLGRYERFLGQVMLEEQNITTGQVYYEVIRREREGKYLGKCVQIIPHVTDEIKRRIRSISERDNVKVTITEIGGTVGDIEGMPFYEAARQMRLEEGYANTLFVHVALVPFLEATEEYKTKPLQHSVQELRRIGIQPDIVVARARGDFPEAVKEKIALFSNVPKDFVFTAKDLPTVYQLPLVLEEQGLGNLLCKRLGMNNDNPDWSEWKIVIDSLLNFKESVNIAVVGKYVKLADSYISVIEALSLSGAKLGLKVNISYTEAENLDRNNLETYLNNVHGILIPGGYGSRGAEGKILAIEFARTRDLPLLGICFGFQLATVEFCRNVLNLHDANSTEIDPNTQHPVISLSGEQVGVTRLGDTQRLGALPVYLKSGTLAERLYGREVIYERHRHRYEVNNSYLSRIENAGMVASAFSGDGRVEAFEIPSHYYYLTVQYHPEFKSWPGRPDPAFLAFVKAAFDKKEDKEKFELPKIDYDYPASRLLLR